MKELNFSVNMDEFLPLRDVVFNTLSLPINWESAGRPFEKRSESWNWKGLCLLFREKVLRWLISKKRA